MFAILNLAIDYVKNKEFNNKEFFDDFIEPLFAEFEDTSKQYMRLFDSESIEEMQSIRQGYIQIRLKITELVDVYKPGIKDEKVRDFLNAIQSFFFSHQRVSSFGEDYIDAVSKLTPSDPQRKQLQIDNIEQQQESWRCAARLYGELKLKYKRPIGS